MRLTGAVLGNVLVFGGQVFYPRLRGGRARPTGSRRTPTRTRPGAVMMVEGSFVTILLFAWLFLRAAREGEERQELLDLAAANGVELTEARAARAVAAGRGAELRRRIEGASR